MFVLSTFFEALALLVSMVLKAYMWILIARVIISWVNPDPYNPIVQFLYRITEPVLGPLRRLIPIQAMGIDFSPILAFIAIAFLQQFLVNILYQVAQLFR